MFLPRSLIAFLLASKPIIAQYDTGAVGSRIVSVTGDSTSTQESQLFSLGGNAGFSVALDRETIVVGAISFPETAYFLQKQMDGTYSQTTLGTSSMSGFGRSVAVHNGIAVVGAPGAGFGTGEAFVYQKQINGGFSETELGPDVGDFFDGFGGAVAVHGDTIIIGARGDDDQALDAGAVYVFKKQGDNTIAQEQKLFAVDGEASDRFGFSVDTNGDWIVVGAQEAGITNFGAAYVFKKQNDGTFGFFQKLEADDAADGDQFGYSVAIYGDIVAVGAALADDKGSDSGAAYVFQMSSDGGSFQQIQKLVATDGAANDQFGYTVGVSGDTIVVGAFQDDDKGADSGAAYIFQKSGGTIFQVSKLIPSDGEAGDNFGRSLAVDGDTIVVGTQTGTFYVF